MPARQLRRSAASVLAVPAVLVGCSANTGPGPGPIAPPAAPIVITSAPAPRDRTAESKFLRLLRAQFPNVSAGDDNLLMLARFVCDELDAGRTPDQLAGGLGAAYGSDRGRLAVALSTLAGAAHTMCPTHGAAVDAYTRSKASVASP